MSFDVLGFLGKSHISGIIDLYVVARISSIFHLFFFLFFFPFFSRFNFSCFSFFFFSICFQWFGNGAFEGEPHFHVVHFSFFHFSQCLTLDVSSVVGAPWRCGVLTT